MSQEEVLKQRNGQRGVQGIKKEQAISRELARMPLTARGLLPPFPF